MFDADQPFNDLPDLPPPVDLETPAVLKAAIGAHRALAELKGSGEVIPNQNILLNALTLQEAQLSSEIEGIITTTDRLYRALSIKSEADDPHTKEVLRYRDALWHGVKRMREGRPLSTVLFEELVQIIKQNRSGIRTGPGTKLQNQRTQRIVYTPPVGEGLIRDKLANLEAFLHADDGIDPLIKLAVGHYQFEAIHPFHDGNGRVGRILNMLYLMQHTLLNEPVVYLSRYIIQQKSDYYRLLREVTEQQAWEKWVLYMLDAVRVTSESTLAQIHAIRDLMSGFAGELRERAPKLYSKELVELLFTMPYCKTKIVVDAGLGQRQTAAKYLKTLAEEGFLIPIKIGREVIYVNSRFLDLLARPDVAEIDTSP